LPGLEDEFSLNCPRPWLPGSGRLHARLGSSSFRERSSWYGRPQPGDARAVQEGLADGGGGSRPLSKRVRCHSFNQRPCSNLRPDAGGRTGRPTWKLHGCRADHGHSIVWQIHVHASAGFRRKNAGLPSANPSRERDLHSRQETGHRGHHPRPGHTLSHAHGRADAARSRTGAAQQEFAAASGEVSWLEGCRAPISAALCGSDCQ